MRTFWNSFWVCLALLVGFVWWISDAQAALIYMCAGLACAFILALALGFGAAAKMGGDDDGTED